MQRYTRKPLATSGASGTWLKILNYGTGVVTVAASGQNINGVGTSQTLAAGSASAPTGIFVQSDGTNYFAQPYIAGGGTTVNVNGSSVSSPNFNGTTPATTLGNQNVAFQVSGSSVSGQINPAVQGAAFSLGTVTTTVTIDPANGAYQTMLLTTATAVVPTFTQPGSGTSKVTIKVSQASAGSGTINWSGKAYFPGGIAPVMTAANNAIDVYSCFLDGTIVMCTAGQNFVIAP